MGWCTITDLKTGETEFLGDEVNRQRYLEKERKMNGGGYEEAVSNAFGSGVIEDDGMNGGNNEL